MGITALVLVVLLLFLTIDYRLEVTQYIVKTAQLSDTGLSFRVVHLSDLHRAWFGRGQQLLIDAIAAQRPDLIVMTGDMMDRKSRSVDPVEALLKGIAHLAPIFSVSGNHERGNPALYAQLRQLYEAYGVVELSNEMAELRWQGLRVCVGGLPDGQMARGRFSKTALPAPPKESLSLLLYHNTGQYETITALGLGYQYLFTGHTHGGLIRLPFAGGVVDNDFHFFPQYDSGMFSQKIPAMISSRGLGDSINVPVPRINNRPEVVCVMFEPL